MAMKRLAKLVLLFFLTAASAQGANHYVRKGAVGTGAGADWTNAYTDFGSGAGKIGCGSLVRGDTYYVADSDTGNYTGCNFTVATSGTTIITIKKATVADHGTEAGWVSTYGDGQAVFPTAVFSTGYWTFDGAARTTITSGHGFKIDASIDLTQPASLWIHRDSTFSNITIKYVEVAGRGQSDTTNLIGFQANGTGANTHSNITLGFSYLHDFGKGGPIRLGQCTGGILIEQSIIQRNHSDAADHSEAISVNDCDGVIVRNNVFSDIAGTGFIVSLNSGTPVTENNWQIYGNVFHHPASPTTEIGGDGVIVCINGNNCTNWLIFNNAFVTINSPSTSRVCLFDTGTPSGNEVRNNIWYVSPSAINCTMGTTNSHNYYITTTHTNGETGEQTAPTTDPFVNRATLDFRLVANTNARTATSLDPIFDADGISIINSRGAFQFITGGSPATSYSPSSLTFAEMPVGHGTVTQTITLTEVGNAALTVSSVAASGTNAADFHVTSTCGAVSALGTCTITIYFNPQAAGARSGSVTVTSDAASSPDVLTLSGTAVTKSSIALVGVPQ